MRPVARITLPLADGFYETDSLPVSSQNCVNLLPVLEDADALVMETLREAPGVTLVFPDPNVPLFDPLGPPDPDSPADPSGPEPPDPDAVPEIPDAPKPDLDEDSVPGGDPGIDPGDGDTPTYPPSEFPECAPYDCLAFESSWPLPARSGYTLSEKAEPDWSEWFPIPGFSVNVLNAPLSDFNASAYPEELPESALSDPVIDPCVGPLLTVLRTTNAQVDYDTSGTSTVIGMWSLKSGTTANDFPNIVGAANARILDPAGVQRGNVTSIAMNFLEIGSTPLSQFSVEITATNSRLPGETTTIGGSSATYGPYDTEPLDTENLNSWILSGFEGFVDLGAQFVDGTFIYLPVQIKVYLAWNGGTETRTITHNFNWRWGTSASGTIDSVDWPVVRISNNNVRIAALGTTDVDPFTQEQFNAMVLAWRRSRESYTPPSYC
jgi:hypothetical protein